MGCVNQFECRSLKPVETLAIMGLMDKLESVLVFNKTLLSVMP